MKNIMMPSKFSLISCKTVLCLVIFCVISFILGTKANLSKNKFSISDYSCYAVSTDYWYYDSASLSKKTTILYPQVSFNNSSNGSIEKKINSQLGNYFVENLDGSVIYKGKEINFHLKSNDYLSVQSIYTKNNDKEWDETCCTIDINNGEIVYLNSLIDINMALVKRIKTSGFAKVDIYDDIMQPVDGNVYRQNYLDLFSEEEIYNRLVMCSEPYDKSIHNKPSFYLEKDRLYFVNLFEWDAYSNPIVFYIELSDIDEFLNVEGW